MIDRTDLNPRPDGIKAFAQILAVRNHMKGKKRPEGEPSGRLLSVVAGARSHLYRTVLRT
jgi:hypothetical protein